MTLLPDWVEAARGQWAWRGQVRPPFAVVPGPGQESVWDYPRPPRLRPDPREVVVRWGDVEVARTCRALRVLETSHPPSYYLPWDDVATHLLEPTPGTSFCEWKGPASYWALVDGDRRLAGVAWSYPQPLPGAEALAACVAFYAGALDFPYAIDVERRRQRAGNGFPMLGAAVEPLGAQRSQARPAIAAPTPAGPFFEALI